MFRRTPPLQKMLRRLPLSPKQAGKEYYKGNRVGSMGTIDQYGNFRPDWNKIRTYVYPVNGTQNAELTPFVAAGLPKTRRSTARHTENYPKYFTGGDYLRAWKLGGGHDIIEHVVEDAASAGRKGATRRNLPGPGEDKVVPFEDKVGAKV